jgi:hypothetical protein
MAQPQHNVGVDKEHVHDVHPTLQGSIRRLIANTNDKPAAAIAAQTTWACMCLLWLLCCLSEAESV